MKQQRGFTLIELVMVIVILGILAATALPKFLDLKSEAADSAVQGMGGTAASAMSLNYAGCAAKGNVADNSSATSKCRTVDTCSDLTNVLQGGLPSSYTVQRAGGATDSAVTTNGTSFNCEVVSAADTTKKAGFTAIAAGN